MLAGPSWRPNVRPPGPPPRMQWPHHGPPPPGPGPHGGPPHFGPPRHRMPYNQPPNLPDSTHNFQGSAKRKHPANNYPQVMFVEISTLMMVSVLCRIKMLPVVGHVLGLRETLRVRAATANVALTLMKYTYMPI